MLPTMMETALHILLLIATFLVMEGVAWATHKYVMHGLLWRLHRDHHHKDHQHPLERNDLFFVVFALPSIACFLAGTAGGPQALWTWVGAGILLYGIAYFLVHEVFIHQRLRWWRRSNNAYLRALRRAHKVHHKKPGRNDGECFGMLWVPRRFLRSERSDRS